MMKRYCSAALSLASTLLLALAVGCGSPIVGEYHAEVRLAAGKNESRERGYSLDEMKAKLQAKPKSLKVLSNGRYTLNTGTAINEGAWRVEGEILIAPNGISQDFQIEQTFCTQWIEARLCRLKHLPGFRSAGG
ncbi:MAG: hypothetical protein JW808_03285 [Victivallales bacterium]|nr:hypothetical protein [Victivallales bacterium]